MTAKTKKVAAWARISRGEIVEIVMQPKPAKQIIPIFGKVGSIVLGYMPCEIAISFPTKKSAGKVGKKKV